MLVASSRSLSLGMGRSYSGGGATSIRDRVRRATAMVPAPKPSSLYSDALVRRWHLILRSTSLLIPLPWASATVFHTGSRCETDVWTSAYMLPGKAVPFAICA